MKKATNDLAFESTLLYVAFILTMIGGAIKFAVNRTSGDFILTWICIPLVMIGLISLAYKIYQANKAPTVPCKKEDKYK